MQAKHYKGILYFIISVIAITFATQIYWTYKNYQSGKQALINDIQVSLDNAVDRYYSELAQENTFSFFSDSINLMGSNRFPKALQYHSLITDGKIDSSIINVDSLNLKDITSISIYDDENNSFQESLTISHNGKDTLIEQCIPLDSKSQGPFWRRSIASRFPNLFIKSDSLQNTFVADSIYLNVDVRSFQEFASKIILSVMKDTLSFDRMNALVDDELKRKNIGVDYGMSFTDPTGFIQKSNNRILENASLHTTSKSAYLPRRSVLQLSFMNETATILKKNLLGILISFILLSTVIACLVYLLRIINAQKQIAEIKNDLISNITHEFKTPIATIHTALEGIQSFNKTGDPEKTSKYLKMSSQQVDKLNTMVEKLLETATLDSGELVLQKEEINLVPLLQQIIAKYREMTPDKTFDFQTPSDNIWLSIDLFHFENAIDNLLDNAVKYGGDVIKVSFKKQSSALLITISDSGAGLTKMQATQLFEKFYRVPKGNTHDVKGFGIGLFYTKTIIEKHLGQIQVGIQPNTQFKINLPYV